MILETITLLSFIGFSLYAIKTIIEKTTKD